jgi:hypothetical protein
VPFGRIRCWLVRLLLYLLFLLFLLYRPLLFLLRLILLLFGVVNELLLIVMQWPLLRIWRYS